MNLNLDKEDLISLVKGSCPYYSLFNHPVVKACGQYSDNRGWSWREGELEKLDENQLFVLYELCKNS